jgi:hypothetical protein
VVDIVDSHQLFQNQWKQRKRYYKKCNYRIRYIESRKYCGMNFDWNTDKTWLPVFEPKIEIENGEKVKKNNCKISCVGSDESSGSEDDTNNLTAFGGKCCIQLDEF